MVLQTRILAGPRVLGTPTAFTCGTVNRLFVCRPDDEDRLASFSSLQLVIQKIAKAMASAGKQLPFNLVEVSVDGRIGPTTTTAAKFLSAVFAGAVNPPPEVAALLDPNLSAEKGIRHLAEHVDSIRKFLYETYRDHPEVLRNDPVVIVKEPPKSRLLPVALPVLGFGTMLVASVVAVSIFMAKGGSTASVLTGSRR